MKKYIIAIFMLSAFEGIPNNAFAQVSNLNIWLGPTVNNTVNPGPYTGGIYAPYFYDSLTPELTIPGDINLSNISMSAFGGYVSSGVEVYNYGKFTFTGTSDIGIDSGMVLCTGRVPYLENYGSAYDSPGVYSGIAHPASFNSTGQNPGYSDWTPFATNMNNPRLFQYPELVALNDNDSIADANVLDFDFVAKGDHIRLQYVFASEEYPENSCALPNDVMGIFLSKPGTPGYENIALVPGTTTPVGVRSINPVGCGEGNNSQYYVDNTNGQNVIFDGFTTVLTASEQVIPCDTYHLRIAVADGAWHPGAADSLEEIPNQEQILGHSMGFYDSGIFLKNHSLRSTEDVSAAAYGGIVGDTVAPYAVRGCLPGGFRIYRAIAQAWPLTLHYTLSGNAIPGQDYTPLSGTATIPANATSVDIPVTALTAGSGAKSLKLKIQSPYSTCTAMAAPDLDSAVLNIYDDGAYAQIITPDTAICTGCSAQLLVAGDPGLQYAWTPATGLDYPNAQNPVASPGQHTHYFMTATQPAPATCLPAKDSVWVYVGNVGINKVNNNIPGFSVVPNPFRESFHIVTKEAQNKRCILELLNTMGRKVLSLQGSIAEINEDLALSDIVKKLPEGNYFVSLAEKGSKKTALKLVKIK